MKNATNDPALAPVVSLPSDLIVRLQNLCTKLGV